MSLVFWNSLAAESVRFNENRRALRSSKNQIDDALSRILGFFTCNVRYGVIIRKEVVRVARKKKQSHFFDHTYCIQGLNITTSQYSTKENGHKLYSLYRYKAIIRCTHLVARILQHGCKH